MTQLLNTKSYKAKSSTFQSFARKNFSKVLLPFVYTQVAY